jgi:hypothetical protein
MTNRIAAEAVPQRQSAYDYWRPPIVRNRPSDPRKKIVEPFAWLSKPCRERPAFSSVFRRFRVMPGFVSLMISDIYLLFELYSQQIKHAI